MDEMEKIEKLREKANVSYEEARDALRACDGDLLDALVYLEKRGKTQGPEQSSYSTSFEEQAQYEEVEEKVRDARSKAYRRGNSIGRLVKKAWDIIISTSLRVTRHDNEVAVLPLWAVLIALLIRWKLVLILMVVALFFGIRYELIGRHDLHSANEFMDKAGDMADKVKKEFTKE